MVIFKNIKDWCLAFLHILFKFVDRKTSTWQGDLQTY